MFDKKSIIKELSFWILFNLNLFIAYIIGYTSSYFIFNIPYLYFFIAIPITLDIFFIKIYENKRNILFKHEILINIYFILNLLFAFIIGLYQPFMQSNNALLFPIVMIPMLLILNYILLNRLNYYLKDSDSDLISEEKSIQKGEINSPIIEYEENKYIFSINSLLLLTVGAPLSAYLIYLFFDLEINYWLHEIVVKQTVYFLNLFFDIGVQASYTPMDRYHWNFINIGSRPSISFETFCTGIQAICVFAGVIIFTPHSQDKNTNRDILWRKTKSLVISSLIFYVVNIIRMLIQIYLYYIGYAWEDIHYSISAASSFIAAIIVLLLHKWIPEFIISIIYSYTLIKQKIGGKSKKV